MRGGTLPYILASRNKEDALVLFLDIGVERDAVYDQRYTPLHIAVAGSRAAITRLLLDSGGRRGPNTIAYSCRRPKYQCRRAPSRQGGRQVSE